MTHSDSNYPHDALHIWAEIQPVDEYNATRLNQIPAQQYTVTAIDQYPPGHVETQTMQTVNCRLCRPCRLCRLSVIFLLVPQFSSKTFTIVSCFLSLCALCITIICCTDVYLQGSWVGNEKITGSCLPADVKAVSRAFSCAAFTQERARWRKVSCFFL